MVVNNLNIAKPPAGEPTLLTVDEVRTLFHEFGHALHGLLSDVRLPAASPGTSVPRDFVEFPSQVNEMWMLLAGGAGATTPCTTRPVSRCPPRLVERLLRARRLRRGLPHRGVPGRGAAGLGVAQLRPRTPTRATPQEFEAAALRAAGLDLPLIPPRYRSTYFAHVFAGDYSAGYYAYIWSEVLDADTVEWFGGNGLPVRESGEAFRRGLLSRGGSVGMMDAYRGVVGREPRIEPLLARRGLLV